MAKTTWIPPRLKNQLHCGIVAGGRGMESSVAAQAGSHYGGPQNGFRRIGEGGGGSRGSDETPFGT